MPANSISSALRAAGWKNETEVRDRIKELLSARAWPVEKVARLFGLTVSQALALAARPRLH